MECVDSVGRIMEEPQREDYGRASEVIIKIILTPAVCIDVQCTEFAHWNLFAI